MNKRRIIIHIDEVRRDTISLHLLGFQLEKLGWDVWYSNRYNLIYLIENVKPNAVTMHNLSTVPPDLILKYSDRINFYIIPGEFYLTNENVIKTVYLKKNYESVNKIINKVFSWGEYQKRKLIELGIFDDTQVEVTGCYRHDLLKICNERNIISKKKQIGFISNLGAINIYDDRSRLLAADSLRNCQGRYYPVNRNLEDFYWTYYSTARMTFEIVDKIIFDKKKNIFYRPHHRENINGFSYFVQKYANKFFLDYGEFHEFLFGNKNICAFASTSLLEGLMFDRSVVSLNAINEERIKEHFNMPNYFYPFLKFCKNPKSVDEAVELLTSSESFFVEKNFKEEFDCHVKDFFDHPHSYYSTQKIAEIIDKTCDKENIKINSIPLLKIQIESLKKHIAHIAYKKRNLRTNKLNNNFCPWCHKDKVEKARELFKYMES